MSALIFTWQKTGPNESAGLSGQRQAFSSCRFSCGRSGNDPGKCQKIPDAVSEEPEELPEKRKPRAEYYLLYMDDFVILHRSIFLNKHLQITTIDCDASIVKSNAFFPCRTLLSIGRGISLQTVLSLQAR
jgi:hypothetical protein